MKKLLLASTALVAFAGAAAAEITISGTAKMGLVGGSADGDYTISGYTTETGAVDDMGTLNDADDVWATTDSDVSGSFDHNIPSNFFQDVDVSFTMSGSTDGGLSFGTKVDLDEAHKLADEFLNQGVAIYVSGEFGVVTLGDTDGAAAAVLWDPDELSGGLDTLNDADTTHFGYSDGWLDGSGDDQVLSYAYTYQGFKFVGSLEQMPAAKDGKVVDGDDDLTWGIGVGYDYAFNGGVASFGAAYQWSDNGSITFESADANIVLDEDLRIGSGNAYVWGLTAAVALDSGFTGGVTFNQYEFQDLDVNVDNWFVGVGYTYDAFSVGAMYGWYTDNDDRNIGGWGLAANYDLGGGLILAAGYGYSTFEGTYYADFDDDGSDEAIDITDGKGDNWSFGLMMAF